MSVIFRTEIEGHSKVRGSLFGYERSRQGSREFTMRQEMSKMLENVGSHHKRILYLLACVRNFVRLSKGAI